jgi:hypothetical protein
MIIDGNFQPELSGPIKFKNFFMIPGRENARKKAVGDPTASDRCVYILGYLITFRSSTR